MTRFAVLFRISVIIFIAEALIMVCFSLFEFMLSSEVAVIIDAVFLVVLSTPAIYLWVTKPYIDARDKSEAALQEAREGLEERVKERTVELEEEVAERTRAVNELRDKTKLVDLLHSVTITFDEAETVESAMQICIDRLCAYSGWPVGHVYVMSKDEPETLAPTKIWHLDDPKKFANFRKVTEETIFKSGVGLPGRVLASGEPSWIKNVADDQNFPRANIAVDIGVKTGFAFPILMGAEVVAVWEFFSSEIIEPNETMLLAMVDIGSRLGRLIERRSAVHDLAVSEKRKGAILESALDGIVTIDEGGNVVEFNPSAEVMFGYKSDDVVGKDVAELIIPKHLRKSHLKGFNRYLKTGKGKILGQRIELTALRTSGDEFPVELTVTPIQLKDQQFFTAFIRDITVRKKAKESLSEKTAFINNILQSSKNLSIVATDLDYRIIYFNPVAEDIFGYKADNVIGKTVLEIHVMENVEPERFEKAVEIVRDKGAYSYTVTQENKGVERFISSVVTGILDDGGELIGFALMSEDITERKTTEKALREAKELAEMASLAKTEFLANMSHELRTPLNSIIGFSDILAGETFGPIGKPEYLDYAKDVNDSGKHLLALINDILDVSRIEVDGLQLEEQKLDIAMVLESCFRLVRERAKRAGLTLKTDFADSLPLLFADERRIKQIVINLLANAIKFTPKGGKVTLAAELDGNGCFVLTVSDTGIGIAPKDVQKVLSVFGQADGSLARKYEGAGLGLPLSKKLAELHGGELTVVSKPGVGATIKVAFPKERLLKD